MRKLGLIVNPIAGMGGRVGLKGTDGDKVLRTALSLGAEPRAHERAAQTLGVITGAAPELTVVTCAGPMGEDAAQQSGACPVVLDGLPVERLRTTSSDTRLAALEMQRRGVDLLLFAGGDGTARDICDALGGDSSSSTSMSVLGIPAGVKMHSGVFALTPRRAGEIALRFLVGDADDSSCAEVMDIDEEAFRSGQVTATLYGYLKTPLDSDGVQSTKAGTVAGDADTHRDIARRVTSEMLPGALYIIGPGTTTAAIPEALGIPNTLLGVDVVLDRELIAADASESSLLKLTDNRPAKIVVSVIGGQGYIFGRGNQQISPTVIRRVGTDNIIVVATQRKLIELRGQPLLVDTGDPALDEELSGYARIATGFKESQVHRISS